MNTTNAKLYTLEYSNAKTWLVAALFVAGNIVLPQLCHLIPQGGLRLLPIYFFTLIAAYKYGWKAGLLTAVASPLANSLLFGMPMAASLPAIMLKSVVLALAAAFFARKAGKVSLAAVALAVAAYQIVGTLGEWAMGDTFFEALQDFRIGLPGIILQIFGGWAVLRFLLRK